MRSIWLWSQFPVNDALPRPHNVLDTNASLLLLDSSFELHGIFVVEFLPSEIYCPSKPMFGVLGH